MWLVIRWILLQLAVVSLANSTIGRKIFASGAGGQGSPLGLGGPAPLAKILRPIVEFVNQTMHSTANGRANNKPHLANYANICLNNKFNNKLKHVN